MRDYAECKSRIEARIAELTARAQGIEDDLDHQKPRDLSDQAIDLEDDEMLESLGHAAQNEIEHLHFALSLMDIDEYGLCQKCGGDSSKARLDAVLYAVLCKECATAAQSQRS